ncbi:ejaculatory bulb-specific protein 3-like [Aricia agestis]|uniref:ejaculatory bulb-specific protein 3-like n=1 Tax=Aricia agestis TaxID=91739 RepID=UPI001C209ED9|nr:ejaculatory bulb-specific protein 3-like [Aricia agestis]
MTSAYDDIDDNFDHNSQLNDIKQLRQLLDCFLDKGYCTEVESHIKAHLPDQIITNCQNCDTVQKHFARIFFNNVKKNFPEEYEEYKKKYDLDGKHLESLEKAISTF